MWADRGDQMTGTAKLFAAYLSMKKNDLFRIEELGDDHHSVIFRMEASLRGQTIPIGVICDDTIYTVIRANLATHVLNDDNAFAIQSLMMRLNHGSKIFKYYLSPDGSVILDACVPQLEGHFSADLVMTILGVMTDELRREYPSFLKIIWNL